MMTIRWTQNILILSITIWSFLALAFYFYYLNSDENKSTQNYPHDPPERSIIKKPIVEEISDVTTHPSFTVDILSVGSVTMLDLLHLQQETFASHISVRNFFNVTEVDDADPDCSKYLTLEDVMMVSKFCRTRPTVDLSPIFRHMRGKYAREQWLQKKANPMGWLCAIVRPYSGLMKVYQHYKVSKEMLPDYLIIIDDDTYYNMEQFQQNFEMMNSSEELYYAGCLVRDPIHMINNTFPFGGYGSILSKGSIHNLMNPINCDHPPQSIKDHSLCTRLNENNVEEKQYFKSGMNLIELMYYYTSTNRYRDVKDWNILDESKHGFCMHSDWVIGYFANYYFVSKHVADPFYANVPHSRIEAYKGSEIYRKGTGFCASATRDPTAEGNCPPGSEICHKASQEWIRNETERLRRKFPDKFRT